MAGAGARSYVDYDDLADVLYIRIRQPRDTLGEMNEEDIVYVLDARTGELVGVDIINFWQRFVRQDGTLDEQALQKALVAPFSHMIDDIRRELLPA